MTHEFSIRPALPGEEPAIMRCLRSAFEPYRLYYTPAAYSDTVLTEDTILQRIMEMTVFVALNRSGDVIGTLACRLVSPGHGHLRGMAVLAEWQGKGVAQELLRAAEDHLKDQGCSLITLNTTVPLKRAVRFYEKNGYQASGKVKDFFGMPLFGYEKVLRK